MFKPTMRYVLLILIHACGGAAARAECGPHPSDTAAVLLGSFACVADPASGAGGEAGRGDLYLPEAGSGSCRTQFEVCVWRTAGNRIDYVIQAASITFSGDCGAEIDAVATVALFDIMAAAAVQRGAVLGYGNCGATCNPGDTCRVFESSCVLREGSGDATTFAACDENAFCARTYVVCCPDGPSLPSIQLVPAVTVAACSSAGGLLPGCEVTCP